MSIDLKIPRINEETAQAIDQYDLKTLERDIAKSNNNPYEPIRKLIDLAPDFAVQALTLQTVDAYRKQGKLEEWIQEFDLQFPDNRTVNYSYSYVLAPFAPLEERGLYIPQARKQGTDTYNLGFGTKDSTSLFNGHMSNYIDCAYERGSRDQWINVHGLKVGYPGVLTSRHWTPWDFEMEELIQLARTRFVPDSLKGMLRYVDDYVERTENESEEIKTRRLQLQEYYAKVIEMCVPSA